MRRFDGSIVIVTGAARGQGRGIARAFAEAGAHLAICDIGTSSGGTDYALSGSQELAVAAQELEALGAKVVARACDVRSTEEVDQFVAAVVKEMSGAPRVLVNNAGILPGMIRAHEITDAQYENVLSVNLGGAFRMSRAVIPHMIAAGGGRIVNISSAAGLTAAPMFSVYCASKHAVVGLTRAMAAELAEDQITVNAVCPGAVVTPMVNTPPKCSPAKAASPPRRRSTASWPPISSKSSSRQNRWRALSSSSPTRNSRPPLVSRCRSTEAGRLDREVGKHPLPCTTVARRTVQQQEARPDARTRRGHLHPVDVDVIHRAIVPRTRSSLVGRPRA